MDRILNKNSCVIGISKLIAKTGMTRKQILSHIENGNIGHQYSGKNLVFELNELNRLMGQRESHIGLWEFVNGILDDDAIFSTNRPSNKNDLIEYLNTNNWFEIKYILSEDVYFTSTNGEEYFIEKNCTADAKGHISLWLNSYKRNDRDKMRLLLKWIRYKHPRTGKLIAEFIIKNRPNSKAMWVLLDYLAFNLKTEILDVSDKELEQLSMAIANELPLTSARVFSAFLLYLKLNKHMTNGWNYHYGSRSKLKNNTAYSIATFSKMAYLVFNEEMWNEHNLLLKALSSKKHANLWLFVSLHFICAWRSSDISKLPKPRLSQKGSLVREKIRSGIYSTDDTLLELETTLKNMTIRPSKSKSSKHAPNLKLFFPESLRKPLGILLTIASSWCDDIETGMPFIKRAGDISEIKEFFGMDFLNLCDDKRFSTRRANKSYLQGIEITADSSDTRAKGYMIAALARSHKGGISKLSNITDIYLKDANFTGCTPEFIAKEMFERGVFSFIPSILLEMYSDEVYPKLHVSAQTKMIANIGIPSTGIENVAELTAKSLDSAKNAVMQIINHPENMNAKISTILQNIATGAASSKQNNCMCLRIAANLACSYPERSCCIGCGYEVYTKSIIDFLISEYKRLTRLKNQSSELEAVRYSKILTTAIMPALTEIISSIKKLDSNYDTLSLLKGVFNDVTYKR